ncbi:MAG: alpha/beta hydrolase [Mesorhizobium sp.]|nr:alpha/beta hydrolase [Mesorhizobium sp.]MBL8577034.1 alpha/beta hydrolase [Mesorhizobium sp.]
MKRFVIIGGLIFIAAVIAMSMYHPPMRLMPAPEVFIDGQTSVFPSYPTAVTDPEIKLFYATNRLPVGPRSNRLYAVVPGRDLQAGVATVRIGEEGTTWDKIYAWSTGAGDDRRPFLNLTNLNEQATIPSGEPLSPEATAWFAEINKALANSRDKDIIIYVHGANTTVERAAGQAAQLHHFTGRNSVVILFAWPTAESFLRYSRDMVTAFGASPHLAEFIKLLDANTNAEKIDVFTYSAGGTVGSDALAIVGRDAAAPGASAPKLGEIYHAAPDADFRAFVDDMALYAPKAERVTVAVNLGDTALRLSQLINRASRAGRPDMRELNQEQTDWLLNASRDYGVDVLRVRPENIPGLSSRSHTFWYDDPWVSSDVLITLLYDLPAAERGLDEGKTDAGARYWTFPTDYPERLATVLDRLRKDDALLEPKQ